MKSANNNNNKKSLLEMCELRKQNWRTEDETRTRRVTKPGKANGNIPLYIFVQKPLFKLSEMPYVIA